MIRNLKGAVVTTLVIVLVSAAVGFAGGVGFCMWLNRDGGAGDEEAVPVDATVTEEVTETTTEITTETELITTVQNAEYVEVVVDGDTYFYSGKRFELEELAAEISKDKTLMVKISYTDTATQFAYEELVKMLKENGIEYSENN